MDGTKGQVTRIALAVTLVAVAGIVGATGAVSAVDEATVEDVNDDLRESNDRIETELNDELEEVEGVETIELVDPDADPDDEADRLENDYERLSAEMMETVMAEVNAQAGQELVDADAVDTPEDLRDEADSLEATYGHINEDAIMAAESLRAIADGVEDLEETLVGAAHQLRGEVVGTVTGTVTDADGEPIDGVTVSVDGESDEATTDADGEYELRTMAGSQTLVFDHESFDDAEESVDVAGDDTTDYDVELAAGDDGDEADGEDGMPGFGVAVTLAALALGALAARTATNA